jgi:hypothetical protein
VPVIRGVRLVVSAAARKGGARWAVCNGNEGHGDPRRVFGWLAMERSGVSSEKQEERRIQGRLRSVALCFCVGKSDPYSPSATVRPMTLKATLSGYYNLQPTVSCKSKYMAGHVGLGIHHIYELAGQRGSEGCFTLWPSSREDLGQPLEKTR